MREAEGHLAKRARASELGSMAARRSREKRGRLRRVVGTERERARGMRAAVWAAAGRRSRTRSASSASHAGSWAGVTGS